MMYKPLMCAGYVISFGLGVATYVDPDVTIYALTDLWVMYFIDSVQCVRGYTCMRSIPVNDVLRHHVPFLCLAFPLVSAYWGYGMYAPEFAAMHLMVAPVACTSINESIWVGSNYFSEAFLATKWYSVLHTSVTVAALAHVIGVGGYSILIFIQANPPLMFWPLLIGALICLTCVQIPLLLRASRRLVRLVKN